MASSECRFFKVFASMGGGINTVSKGTAMMGFIKSGIGIVMVPFFFFFLLLFFFESMEIRDTVF